MKIFDYIFYRVARFFYRKDGINAPRAIAIITIIQVLLLGEIIIVVTRIFLPLEKIAFLPISASKIGVVLATALMAFNYFWCRGKYWKLSDRWRESETPSQTALRGWLVVSSILIPFVVLVLLGTVFGRA